MIARLATFADVNVDMADEVVAWIRENAPGVDEVPGMRAGVTLLDRDARRLLGITFFESREALEAVAQMFEELPQRMPDHIRAAVAGKRTSVEILDVVQSQGF